MAQPRNEIWLAETYGDAAPEMLGYDGDEQEDPR